MRRSPYSKSYEERYKKLMGEHLSSVDKQADKAVSANKVKMDDFEGRYNNLINMHLSSIEEAKRVPVQQPEEQKQNALDMTTQPTVKLSDLNKEASPQKSTFGSASKAIAGSLGAGVVNTARNIGNLGEQTSFELYGEQEKPKSLVNANKEETLAILTDMDGLKGKDPKDKTKFDISKTTSNKVLKPVEEKLTEWADLDDENRLVRVLSGAARSIPQSLLTGAVPSVGVPLMFNNVYKSVAEDYEEQGMDLSDPNVRARMLGSTVVEVGSEYIFGLFNKVSKPLLSGITKSAGKTLSVNAAKETGAALVKPTVGNFMKFIAGKASEEGAEEVLSEIGQAIVATLTTDRGRKAFTFGEQYETDPDKGSIRFDEQDRLIVDDNGNPVMFGEDDMPIENTGVTTMDNLIDAFASGAVAAGVISTVSSRAEYKQTKKFVKTHFGTKDLSKITKQDMQELSEYLRQDIKASPALQKEVDESISTSFTNAIMSSFDGQQFTEASTGDVVTMHFDDDSGNIYFDTAIGQTVLTSEQFDEAISSGLFTPIQPAEQTQDMAQSQPEALPVSEQMQSNTQIPLEAQTAPEGIQAAPEAMQETMPAQEPVVAGKAIQTKEGGYAFATDDGRAFDIGQTVNASGSGLDIYSTTVTNPEGKQAKITAKYNAKKNEVDLTVDAEGGIKDKAFTVTLNRLDYEQADNKLLHINDIANNKLGRKFIGFGNDISLYNGVGAVVDLAFANGSEQMMAPAVETKPEVPAVETKPEVTAQDESDNDTSELIGQAEEIAKDKPSFNIAEAAVERFNGYRDLIRKTQDKYMDKDVMKALRAVDKRFEEMGGVGFLNPLRDADLTRSQKRTKEIVQEAIGKKLIFFEAKGSIEADEFVSDWAKDIVFVNANRKTEQSILWTVGHGMYHIMKFDGVHEAFETVAKKYLPDNWQDEYQMRFENLDGYFDSLVENNALLEEAIADRAGDVFTNPKFWSELINRMSQKKKGLAKIKKFLARFIDNPSTRTDEISTMLSIIENYDGGSKEIADNSTKNTAENVAETQEDSGKRPIDLTPFNTVMNEDNVIHKEFGGVDKRIIATAELIHPSGVREALYITKFFKNGFSSLSERQTSEHESRYYYNPSSDVFRLFKGDLNYVPTKSITRVDDMADTRTEEATSEDAVSKHQKAYQAGDFKYYAMVRLDGEDGYHVITADDYATKQEFRDDLRGNGYIIMNNHIGDKADYHMVTEYGKFRTVSSAQKELASLKKLQKGSDNPNAWDSDIADLEATIAEANSKLEPDTKFSIAKKAVEEFGYTTSKYEAGYLMPDGRMLDFSDKKNGGSPNMRIVDHREVNMLYEDDSYKTYTEAMMKFVKDTGAVRISFVDNWQGQMALIDITADHSLTDKQRSMLRRLSMGSSSFAVDLFTDYFKDEATSSWFLEMPRAADINRIFDEVDQILSDMEKGIMPVKDDSPYDSDMYGDSKPAIFDRSADGEPSEVKFSVNKVKIENAELSSTGRVVAESLYALGNIQNNIKNILNGYYKATFKPMFEKGKPVMIEDKKTGLMIQKEAGFGGLSKLNVHNANLVLSKNEQLRSRLLELQNNAIANGVPVEFVNSEGYLIASSIETAPLDKEIQGEPKNRKEQENIKLWAFSRGITQMFLDGLNPTSFEDFRKSLVAVTEKAYKNNKGIKRLGGFPKIFPASGQTLGSIASSAMDGVQPALRSAEKTYGALSLNSLCPMFTVGNHGCYLDGCYLTQMANGATGTNLFKSAMYTGEILQLSNGEIKNLNKAGGLRINGVGDTTNDVMNQWADIIRHANMRGLNLKIITKQAVTFNHLESIKGMGIPIDRVIVQPSLDNLWVPAELDEYRQQNIRGGVVSDNVISNSVKAGNFDAAMFAYDEMYGRESKVIDGVLYRKYGFTENQLNDIRNEHPDINIIPRYVVANAQEIAELALRGESLILTLMHGKVEKELISDFDGPLLNFGAYRHLIRWTKKAGWEFTGVSNKQKKEFKTKSHKIVETYIKTHYTEEQQNTIFRNMKKLMCCQDGTSLDACMDCASHGAVCSCRITKLDDGQTDIEGQKRIDSEYTEHMSGKPDIKFSINKDDLGRSLTELQREYFKDSKITDDNGNLLTVYHGTANGGFNIFDPSKLSMESRTSQQGTGFYFTDNKQWAKEYTKKVDIFGKVSRGTQPQIYETYLNITNPIDISDGARNLTEEQLRGIISNGNYDWGKTWWKKYLLKDENASDNAVFDAYINHVKGKTDKAILQDIHKWFGYGNAAGMMEAFRNATGFDGIVENFKGHKIIVATESEQIKLAANMSPTNTPDIRFSMQAEHGGSRRFTNQYYGDNVLQLITDATRYYDIKTNKESIKNAQYMLANKYDDAITDAMDVSKASAELTIVRLAMSFKEQVNGNYGASANWVHIANKAAKTSAQAVQAHSIFHKMDPNGVIPFAAKEMQSYRSKKDQDDIDAKTKEIQNSMRLTDLAALKKALEDINALNKKLANRNSDLKSKLKAAKELENRLLKNATNNLVDDIITDPISDFVQTLHGVLSTMVPFKEIPKTTDPATFMKWMIKNENKYTDVWGKAVQMFDRLYKNDGIGKAEMLTYFGDLMPDGLTKAQPRTEFTPELMDKIRKAMKQEYTQTFHTFQSMVKRLLELGVTERDAVSLARYLQEAMTELTMEQKIRTLRKILPKDKQNKTEKFISELVNLSNERGLGDGEVGEYIARAAGLPSLTPEMTATLMSLANQRANINETAAREGRKLTKEEERQVHILSATILATIAKNKPVHWTQKVDTIQSMMMLSMFKSAGRNIIGNTLFGAVDTLKDYLSVGVDRILSAYTGEKTVPVPQMKAFKEGAIRGAKESAYDIHHDIDTADMNAAYALYRGEVFKSKLGKLAMRSFRYKMVLPDRVMQVGFYESYLTGLMKMHDVTEPTIEMQEEALLHAQIKTFSDDNVISAVFSKGRNLLNNFYNKEGIKNPDKAYQWGLGSMLIKFPRVPGALLARSLEYSPLNLFRALSYLVKPALQAKKMNADFKSEFAKDYQKKFAVQLANTAFGTATSIGLGLLLAGAGLLTGRREEDKKKRDILATTGIDQYQLNWTGLMRFIASGFDKEAAKMEAGDVLTTYEWLAPMSLGISIGANLYKETETLRAVDIPAIEKFVQTVLVAGMSGLESITEMSLMQGLARFMDSDGYRSSIASADRTEPYFGEKIINTAVSVPASFVPNALRVTKEFLDNTRRTTYSTNPLEYSYRLLLNKLPLASQTLPESRDVYGNLREVYENNGNNVWNVFFNPAFVRKYNPTPEAMIVLNTMAEQEGTELAGKNVAPKAVDKKIPVTVNGERTELVLDDYERSEMQRLAGQNVKEYFRQIPEDFTIEQKVEAMNKILSEISAAAKEHMAKKKLGLE